MTWIISIGVSVLIIGAAMMLLSDELDVEMYGQILVAAALVITPIVAGVWYSSSIKAEKINEKYGTEITAKEMFFAGETIEKVIVGTEHNVNLEGEDNE